MLAEFVSNNHKNNVIDFNHRKINQVKDSTGMFPLMTSRVSNVGKVIIQFYGMAIFGISGHFGK